MNVTPLWRNAGLGICLLVALIAGGCAASVPLKQADLDEIIGDVERKAHLVRQFRAEFVKTRTASIFDRPMSVDGRLVFQQPGKFWLTLKGDINVEILSNGEIIRIVHDDKDEETYQVRGDRDLSRFADPLMLMIESVSSGGLRSFKIVQNIRQDGLLMVEIDPGSENPFERIDRVIFWFSDFGDFKRVRIVFKNGNTDDTQFKSWSLVDDDGPEIRGLNERLGALVASVNKESPDTPPPSDPPPLAKGSDLKSTTER